MLAVNFPMVSLYTLAKTEGYIPLSKVCSLNYTWYDNKCFWENSQPIFHNSLENVFIEQVLIKQFKA